jgi:hypothetical protein
LERFGRHKVTYSDAEHGMFRAYIATLHVSAKNPLQLGLGLIVTGKHFFRSRHESQALAPDSQAYVDWPSTLCKTYVLAEERMDDTTKMLIFRELSALTFCGGLLEASRHVDARGFVLGKRAYNLQRNAEWRPYSGTVGRDLCLSRYPSPLRQ